MNTIDLSRGNRIEIDYKITSSGCWVCTSHKPAENGYPKVTRKDFGAGNIHRYIYWKYVNEDIKNFDIAHKCDNKRCINPDHLEKVSRSKNMRDAYRRNQQDKIEGTDHYKSKLTKQDILDIRNSNKTQTELADLYNVNQSQISRIINNKIYKNIR